MIVFDQALAAKMTKGLKRDIHKATDELPGVPVLAMSADGLNMRIMDSRNRNALVFLGGSETQIVLAATVFQLLGVWSIVVIGLSHFVAVQERMER